MEIVLQGIVFTLLVLTGNGLNSRTLPAIHGAFPVEPPPVYEQWWIEMERCSGRDGPMGDIDWYIVATPERSGSFRCKAYGLPYCDGAYEPARDEIYIGDRYAFDRSLVGHEILHALGYVGHADSLDFKKCDVRIGINGR